MKVENIIKAKLESVEKLIQDTYGDINTLHQELRIIDIYHYDTSLFNDQFGHTVKLIPQLIEKYKDFDIKKFNNIYKKSVEEIFNTKFKPEDFEYRKCKYLDCDIIFRISTNKLYAIQTEGSPYKLPKLNKSMKILISKLEMSYPGFNLGVFRYSKDTISVGFINKFTGTLDTSTRSFVFHFDENEVTGFNVRIPHTSFGTINVWLSSEELDFIIKFKHYLNSIILMNSL